MKDTILELLEANGDLPTLPDIVINLQRMAKDPHANAKTIAKTIEVDPVLAGKILNLSNSVFYSRSTTPIKTLPVAVTKIGMNMLMKLVYSLKLMSLFKSSKAFEIKSFWQHSLAVAIFTQALSQRVRVERTIQDIAYLAGLMHDIGIIVFEYLIQKEYADFLLHVADKEEMLENQELAVFGIDHAELGALFIEKWWHMDKHIINAVRFHHFPFSGPDSERRCEQTVHIANGICNNYGINNGIVAFHEVFKEGAWEQMGLMLSDVESILEDVNSSLDQAKELMIVV